MSIRSYASADLCACAEVLLDGWPAAFPGAGLPDDPATAFRDGTAGERLWVAEVDGRVAGFVSLWTADPFVHYLFVSEQARGRGLGAALLARAVAAATGRVRLKCRLDNPAACRFYDRKGWQRLHVVTDDGPAHVVFGSPAA